MRVSTIDRGLEDTLSIARLALIGRENLIWIKKESARRAASIPRRAKFRKIRLEEVEVMDSTNRAACDPMATCRGGRSTAQATRYPTNLFDPFAWANRDARPHRPVTIDMAMDGTIGCRPSP